MTPKEELANKYGHLVATQTKDFHDGVNAKHHFMDGWDACNKNNLELMNRRITETYNQAIDDCIHKLSSTTEVDRLLNSIKRTI